ncbi:MAG: CheR family methyltransferase, partial [Gemmatimonadales bacterium]
FTAWSAGCASGEEPYSLMMALAERAEGLRRADALQRIKVDATDIDRMCLDRARAACYPLAAFRDAPPELVARYTESGEEGYARVIERLRRRVRVARLDLHRDQPVAPPYEMIVCRNVLIYFDRAGQDRIFRMFADALNPGGLLVLGKVETILGPVRDRFELVDLRERIYRRVA